MSQGTYDVRSESYEVDREFSPSRGSFDASSRPGSVASPGKPYNPPVCRVDIQHYRGANPWSVSCCCAPCANPIYCCSAQICYPCKIYQQRKQLLTAQGVQYQCCAGICGKQYTDPCALYVRGNEDVCLAAEVMLFPCWSAFGNRWMVQQHYNLENSWVDSCFNAFTCPLTLLSYLWQDDVVENCVYMAQPVCGAWLLTQQQVHMDVYGYPLGQNVVRRDMR